MTEIEKKPPDMFNDVSINSYIDEVTILINQLKSFKIEFTDEVRIIHLLMSLHDSWKTLKTLVSNLVRDNTMKFLGVCNLALAKEIC